MSTASYFTFLRILISPLFPLVYLEYSWLGIPQIWMPVVLILILIICDFTDLFDGFIARKQNQVTDLGKILDPMADTITRITVLFTLTQGMISLPLLLVFVFLYRELFISTLRTVCALRGFALAARFSGKVKAVLQAAVSFLIIILMIPYTRGLISLMTLRKVSLILVSIAAVYTVISAIEYVYANRSYIKKAIKT